ncbi:MAG: 50S ribosomal protein L25 [Chloroflexota bacterium]
MDQLELEANPRSIRGKKVRFLRRQGITPVHIYGQEIQSQALQIDTLKLHRIMAQAGGTRLINLKFGGDQASIPVLVREVQKEPLTGRLLHVDFYQVKMSEKVEVEVPVVIVGEAPALKMPENMLMHELDVLTIESLPGSIPSSVEINIDSLAEAEQSIRVKDIDLGPGITILNDPEQVIVKIAAQHEEKVEEEEPVTEEEEGKTPEATSTD